MHARATRPETCCRLVLAVRVLVAGTVAVLAGPVTPAHGQPAAMGLVWEAPASCPDRDSMRDRIEQRLGRSLDDVALGIDVDVKPRGNRYVATIDLGAVT